eukprot:5881502-Pyramimonas_sp.AAC.1
MRLRLVLRGFMNVEAFDVEGYSGTARRPNQSLLASAAARKKQWIIASMDIDKAFLKGLAHRERGRAHCLLYSPTAFSLGATRIARCLVL